MVYALLPRIHIFYYERDKMTENKLLEKLEDLKSKYASLQEQLADPELIADMKRFVQVNKEYKELEPIIAAGAEYRRQVESLDIAKEDRKSVV